MLKKETKVIDDFLHINKSLKSSDIAELEKIIGYKLPNDYKEFLLNHNGGALKEKGWRCVSYLEGETAYLSEIYGINTGDVETDCSGNFNFMVMAPWMFPIGDYLGGPIFLMDLRKSKFGKIYLLNIDFIPNPSPLFNSREFDGSEDYADFVECYFEVAESFSDLMSKPLHRE